MKSIYAILIMSSFIYADFGSSIVYVVQVKDNNLWGVGSSQLINNNQGKGGTITGTASSLSICPCLRYGVSPWLGSSATIPYSYTDDDVKKVLARQTQVGSAYQAACTVSASSTAQKINLTQVFEQAEVFVENLDTVINTIVNLFPDITQGQGYESAAFLNFCTMPTSLIERINTTNSQTFRWANFENYFSNAMFRLSLDLRQLVPSADDIQAGNVFASAMINHYVTLLQTLRVVAGTTPITSDVIIQKEQAIKDALLW